MGEIRSAGVVVFRGNPRQFLLLHYPGGHWEFVKGKIEEGESNKEAAIRETEEETGISDLLFVDGFDKKIEYYFTRQGVKYHKEVIFFLAETQIEHVTISHEHQGFKWASYDDAFKQLTFENARVVLQAAESYIHSR